VRIVGWVVADKAMQIGITFLSTFSYTNFGSEFLYHIKAFFFLLGLFALSIICSFSHPNRVSLDSRVNETA